MAIYHAEDREQGILRSATENRANRRILVVDDSPTDRALMIAPLRQEGFEVIVATNGDQALEKAVHHQPGCILLDVVLPDRDGFQVCRELKRRPECAHIPVIIVSGKSSRIDRTWGLRQGAALYLTKPFDPAELLTSICQCLQQQS